MSKQGPLLREGGDGKTRCGPAPQEPELGSGEEVAVIPLQTVIHSEQRTP